MEQIKTIKTFNFVPNLEGLRSSLKPKSGIGLDKEKESPKKDVGNNSKMKSDNKIVNFSEMIPKLLNSIKSKNSSRVNMLLDNNSFIHNSNSSDLNDDENELNFINDKPSNTIKKIPKLKIENNEPFNEYKNLEAVTYRYRQKNKIDNSPTTSYRKYSKENKHSLVLELHKYFFQDGELENIDTLIKYNINKIKINDNSNKELNPPNNIDNNNLNDDIFDYLSIKEEVVNLMNHFARAFDRENKKDLITAIQNLSSFANKYKFDYVTQLTLDWLTKIREKKYEKCELKYIGYYNQIRDIMNKMLKELKKKADLIIITQRKKMNSIKPENISSPNNNISTAVPVDENLLKKNSINKEDLLKTKEIVPIKIDIEVNNNLNINQVEEILKNLDEGDFGNMGKKENVHNQKKILNKNNNRNEELEAFSYPFKENYICYIF